MKPDTIREAAHRLRAAESSVRVLRHLAWPEDVRRRFLANGGEHLPRVEYPPFDPVPVHTELARVRRLVADDDPIGRWLSRCADSIHTAADMMAAVGTPAFLEHGARLFGKPAEHDGGASALELARLVEGMTREIGHLDLGAPPPACHLADGVAARIRRACRQLFGDQAPRVEVVDELSANALATPDLIRVRRSACFSDRDVHQLIQHEAYVHVCTWLNGRAQHALPILGAAHAGTTRTQEGLAVFAEYISGNLEPDRFRRLAGRVLAIQMALDGADFVEVFRFFEGRGHDREQAFENARRVFRGGVLTGGAPFVKDAVYLDGFLRVTNFLRAAVAEGRADCLLLLFCGKLDLDDLPALAQLSMQGLCQPPRFLPPWLRDRRFLVTYLTYSRFLDTVDLAAHRRRFRELVEHVPDLGWMFETEAVPPQVWGATGAEEANGAGAPGDASSR